MPKGVCRFDRDVDVGQGERTPSATEALRLVREHMKLRRPGVRIEDRHGNPVTFFQLKGLSEAESREKDRS